MKKQNMKKLHVAKETLRSLDLKIVTGGDFDPDYTMNRDCTYSTIAVQPGGW